MTNKISGIHHITAISGNAQRNYDFYTKVLGMKFVKKTVNFDDPYTYHFYYGNEPAEPGTLLTFFPWENIIVGRRGIGQATEIQFSVPKGSFDYWLKRIDEHNVLYNKPSDRFNESYLVVLDPDGLKLEFVISDREDNREQYVKGGIPAEAAIKGFYGTTLTLNNIDKTAKLLTDVFGYKLIDEKVNRFRFAADSNENANYVDLVAVPGESIGNVAGGSVHHVAFRAKDDEEQMMFREILADKGYNITPQIDRMYFKSVYFREPGGVLFEIATDKPGMTVDETVDKLGSSLKLPPMYESKRAEIEKVLPKLD
jgi:glyoxalase family protein